MKSILKNHARLRAARLILWGNVGFLGIAILIFGLATVITLRSDPTEKPDWIYLGLMVALLVMALIALRLTNKSLKTAMEFYAWTGMLCVGAMIAYPYFFLGLETPPAIMFFFHVGIFSLGLVVGWMSAFRYAVVTTVILLGVSVLYRRIDTTLPAIVAAFLMTLPSLLVDRLEKDLQKSEEKFSIVFRKSLDVILVLGADYGEVLSVNQAAHRILGFENDMLVGRHFSKLLPPNSNASLVDLCDTLRRRSSVFVSQFFIRADGSQCPMDLTATLIPWGEGQAILVTLRDVTERKRADEELRKYREHLEDLVEDRTAELEQANQQLREEVAVRRRVEEDLRKRTIELEARNKDLDAFSHTVAHDLKSPLTSIVGFSSLLESRASRMELSELQTCSQMISQNGHRMTRIIDELLLLASVQREDVQHEPLDMEAIVNEVQQRLAEDIEASQAVVVTPTCWPLALGYGPWIEEVWANYLSNALKYGGSPPYVELGATRLSDGHIRFWVRDNGLGISPENQAQLFTAFTRLETKRSEGHGLGLSIVKQIIEKLGGQVELESIVGHGSTFAFTLPCARLSDSDSQPEA